MRARLTARQLAENLGLPLVRVRLGGRELDRPVTGVVIHDPGADQGWEPGAIVLGVGIGHGTALAPLTDEMARCGVVALAVKPPLPEDVEASRIPVLEINPSASLMHVAATIRERLLEQDRAPEPAHETAGDLFAVANTIGDPLGGRQIWVKPRSPRRPRTCAGAGCATRCCTPRLRWLPGLPGGVTTRVCGPRC